MWQRIELGPAWARSKHVVEKIEKTLKIFTTRRRSGLAGRQGISKEHTGWIQTLLQWRRKAKERSGDLSRGGVAGQGDCDRDGNQTE